MIVAKRSIFFAAGAQLTVLQLMLFAATSDTVARPRVYDVNLLMYQPHPFANQSVPTPNFSSPPPAVQMRQPMRVPQLGWATPSTRSTASPSPRRFTPVRLMGDTGKGSGLLSEVRIGGLIHDLGPFSSREEDGFDVNLEVLFKSLEILKRIWSPRPHFGGDFNTGGDTSQIYFGLTWERNFRGNWFWGFSLGGSVHDGKKETNKIDRKELGCTLLFRESLELGYRFNRRHSISAMLDHVSNANICTQNEGLENFGFRYGYSF